MNAVRHIVLCACAGLLGVSLMLTPNSTSADIIYTWLDKGMYTAGDPIGYNLDFDQNGVVDFIFESTGMWLGVLRQGSNMTIAGGNDVDALSEDYAIGSSVPEDKWLSGYLDFLGINSCAVVPGVGLICTGNFLKTNAFMGVRFCDLDGLAHYGWIRIDNPLNSTGGTIVDFAYETEPGVGILAGAGVIPEPATVALMIVAGVGLGLSRLRRNRQGHSRVHPCRS